MLRMGDFARGAALGAALMFLLDPDRGRRRRAGVRDRLVHLERRVERGADTTKRDLAHRAEGIVARAKAGFRREPVEDEVLEARVRSEMGRLVSHPGSVTVRVEGGDVVLEGPLLADEHERLLRRVRRIRGVRGIEDRLEPHPSPDRVPGLQGGRKRPGRRPELLQTNWAPAPRLLAGAAGATLALTGLGRGGLKGLAAALAGSALLARAATNMELSRLIGVGGGRRGIDIQKTFHVRAPVDEVFRYFENFDRFSRIMSGVRDVERLDERRSRWTVEGPARTTLTFEAERTAFVPNEAIGWKTADGSPVRHAGIVRFQSEGEDGTRVDLHMTYNPPGGAIGHAVAALFGQDLKHRLDEDVVRFQSLLETGKTTADGEQVRREEIGI